MQAWLSAAMARQQKLPEIKDAVLWFGKQKRQKREVRRRPRGNVGRRWVEQMEAAGQKVIRLKPGEEPPAQE